MLLSLAIVIVALLLWLMLMMIGCWAFVSDVELACLVRLRIPVDACFVGWLLGARGGSKLCLASA